MSMTPDNKEPEEEEQAGQLARLSELDYEMEEGHPDIIQWAVVTNDGEEIGKVADLLVDLDSGAIMLAEITLTNKATLVPMEAFAMDNEKQRLVLPAERTEVEAAPAFTETTEDVSQFFDYWGAGDYEEEEEEEEAEEEEEENRLS